MERLTRRDEFGNAYSFDSIKAIQKLAEYEDLEKSGRLVKLPCAVGDTVYEVTRNFVSKLCVNRICVFENGAWCDWTIIEGIYPNVQGFRADEIGKTVFLTRAEAEEKLRQKR